MKGLKAIAKATQKINFKDRSTWIPLYYSIREDKAYTTDGDGRYFMTNLINPQTEEDIREAIEYGLNV